MAKNYRTTAPLGQINDHSCWAASLSWFLTANEHQTQPSQNELLDMFAHLKNPDGGISVGSLRNRIYPAFGMATVDITAEDLGYLEPSNPFIIVYNYPRVGGTHMNVVCERLVNMDKGGLGFTVMEPFYPLDAPEGKKRGGFIFYPVSHFTTAPIFLGRLK